MISSRMAKLAVCAGMLVFCAPVLFAGDMTVEGNVTATGFSGSGTELTGVVKTEVDPTVGTLTADKWCKASADGSVISCDQDAPQKSVAFQVWVPRTGQQQCWDENGTLRDCANTGEDGSDFHRAGGRVVAPENAVNWRNAFRANPRFTDHNDGTVTDNLTGLVWLKNANCIGENPGFDNDQTVDDGAVTWQHGLDFVRGMNTGLYDCGDTSNGGGPQTDWRMPTANELLSLTDTSQADPALSPGYPFLNVDPFFNFPYYWSSTSYGGDRSEALYLHLVYAYSMKHWSKTTLPMRVWPVRGGIYGS